MGNKPDNLKCVTSEICADKREENIPIKQFNCLFKNNYSLNCPEAYKCLLRPSDKSLLVNCHERNLPTVPEVLPDRVFQPH